MPPADPLGLGALRSLLATPAELPDELPPFIKPLPSKIGPDERWYLAHKKALTLPSLPLQNALLRAYVEYVHPYMPLLELHDFLNVVNHRDGSAGQVSLFLYQSVMFVATAFVDEQHLKDAGFENRRAARKILFGRTRVSVLAPMECELRPGGVADNHDRSFSMILITKQIAWFLSRPCCSWRIGTRRPTTKRIPGTGSASPSR